MPIKEIEKYLTDCKYKANGFREISSQLYGKYIDNDDKHLIKLIKKLLIIYKRFHIKLMQKMLYKWQIIALKLNYGIYNYKEDENFNLDNELDEPQMEIKPITYLKNMNMDNNFNVDSMNKISKSDVNSFRKSNDNYSKIKKENNKKNNKTKTSLKNKNINLDEFVISNEEDNNQKNLIEEKRKAINEIENKNNNNNKTFEENLKHIQKNYSIEGQEEKYDNLENLIIPSTTTKKNIEKDSDFYSFNNIESNIDKNEINYLTYLSDFNFNTTKSKSVDKNLSVTNTMHSKAKPWAYSYKVDNNNNIDDFMIKMKSKKKKPQMNNIERQALFNNLYNDGKKRQEKFLMLSMEKEAKFNSTYTFTPKVIHNKLNEKYLKNMADSKFNISKNTSTNNIRIGNLKNYSELPIVMEENKDENQLDFMTRLAEYEKIKQTNLEKIKNEVEQNIRGSKTNNNKNIFYYGRMPYSHLINNTDNYFENKQKNLEKITKDMYEEQGITFQPKTNKSINDKIKNDIIERNKDFIKTKQEKLLQKLKVKEKECTFKPKINNLSTISILNNSKNGQQTIASYKTEQNSTDVSKRLFDYQNKYKEKLEDIRSKYKQNYSFKPEISKNTDTILNNKKKLMEQIKEKETDLIDNVQNEVDNGYKDMEENNEINENQNIYNNINNALLVKQMKLGELEKISKRINILQKENMDESEHNISSDSPKKEYDSKLNKNKSLNAKKREVSNDNIDNMKPSMKNIHTNINYENYSKFNDNENNQNSDSILELAKNLLKENLLSKKQNTINMNDNMNYINYNKIKNKNTTNDFGNLLMMNNSNSGYNDRPKNNNYSHEYDFDSIKGNKRIMNLNYYDNLL